MRCGRKVKFKQYLHLRDVTLARLQDLAAGKTVETIKPDMQTYAFLGDAVYTLFVRRKLMATGVSATRVLHDLAAKIVSAKMQSYVLSSLEPELTDWERDFCRRARNAQVTTPASATVAEYRSSTAWEALLGYYSANGEEVRLNELLAKSFRCSVEELQNGQSGNAFNRRP